MKIEQYQEYDVKGKNPREVDIKNSVFLHTSDDEFDYLYSKERENGVKITLKFTKDEEKRNKAIEALKVFFFASILNFAVESLRKRQAYTK